MDLLSSFANLFPVTLSQSLAYGFVALAFMIPFRLFNFPDLTCEGAFPLGAAACAALIISGVHPAAALLFAVVAGFCAGLCTGLIAFQLNVNTFLSGILVATMLWTLNIRVMGRSNLNLVAYPNAFDGGWPGFTQSVTAQLIFWTGGTAFVVAMLLGFLRTQIGLAIRAIGSNERMAIAQGVDVKLLTLLGLGAANAFSAFAGAAIAQIQGYADVGMGLGILVNALASLMIGEAIIGRRTPVRLACAPFVGSVIYYQCTSVALVLGASPADLKLFTAALVITALAASRTFRRQ